VTHIKCIVVTCLYLSTCRVFSGPSDFIIIHFQLRFISQTTVITFVDDVSQQVPNKLRPSEHHIFDRCKENESRE